MNDTEESDDKKGYGIEGDNVKGNMVNGRAGPRKSKF